MAVLAIPSSLQCRLKSLLLPSPTPTIKAFSSFLALNTEETPAMKALKDIPYPSASPDPSIFESSSKEYYRVRFRRARSIFEESSCEYNSVRLPLAVKSAKVKSPRSANRHYHTSRILEELLLNDKFEEAEQVRQELVEMNVPILPSNIYYRAALDVLNRQPWPPNRTELFTNWLSLLPSIPSDIEKRLLFNRINAALFNSHHLDLNAIAQFGIVLSSKGYIRNRGVGPPVVACLMRYADPDVSSRILDEMTAANFDYSRRNPGDTPAETTRKDKRTTKRLWSIAVRTHCNAGRPQVALQMVKRAHEHYLRLSDYTYEYLLGKLEADGLDDLAAELRAQPGCESLDVAKSRLVVDDLDKTPIPPISGKHDMVVNQDIALAILKRGSRPTYAADLVPYFDIYNTHLECEATKTLRSLASEISRNAISNVLLAEQLHYHRRGQFRNALRVFEKCFHVVGVPSEEITRQLLKHKHCPPHSQSSLSDTPHRVTETTSEPPPKLFKLWPRPHHTALVWSALVQLCESEGELFSLYDSLLQHSAQFQKTSVGHDPTHDSSSNSTSTAVSVPLGDMSDDAHTAPADRFDTAHFRPFLIAFTQLGDVEYGLRVLDDMQDRGIAPGAQILSTAAALQARFGPPAVALRILDIIRGQIDNEEEKAGVEVEIGAGSDVGMRERDKKQHVLLSAYTGVLRGFIDRRDLVQARRVAELLGSHLGYVEGRSCSDGGGVDGEDGDGNSGNARTDAALRYLRRLEVVGPDAAPDSVGDLGDTGYFYPYLKKRDSRLMELIGQVIKTLNAPPDANCNYIGSWLPYAPTPPAFSGKWAR